MTPQERIAAILEKCEFYWNQDGICDAEIHAVLERIHEHAREIGKELAGAADVEKLAAVIYERAFDCLWYQCTGAERALWLEVAEAVRRSLQPPLPQSQKLKVWAQDAFCTLAALKEAVTWELAPSIMEEIKKLVDAFPIPEPPPPAKEKA